MAWDGAERRSDDINARVASLEVYSKTQQATITELKTDLRCIRTGVQGISRDLTEVSTSIQNAKVGGRIFLGVAVAAGGMIGWAISFFDKHH